MKRIAYSLIIFALFSIPVVAQKKSTKMSKADSRQGWKKLFDGKTTKGWHTYGQTDVGAAWDVEDGALHLKAGREGNAGGGDLVTDKEYGNFHLKLEWKISK